MKKSEPEGKEEIALGEQFPFFTPLFFFFLVTAQILYLSSHELSALQTIKSKENIWVSEEIALDKQFHFSPMCFFLLPINFRLQ